MKKIATLIFLLTFSKQIPMAQYTPEKSPQPSVQPNSFYIEVLGSSFLGASANYERFLSKRPGGISLRAGLGVGRLIDIFEKDITYGTLPFGISYNLPVSKNGRHLIELGGNYVFVFGTKDDNTQFIMPVIGYRYQSPSAKFQLRATVFPYFFSFADDDGSVITWVGVSFGTRF